jgi:hypothetical protein
MPEPISITKETPMETTLQPSLPQHLRTRITVIEAIELALLGFGFWSLIALIPGNTSTPDVLSLMIFLIITEGILLGSWILYNVYIRIARAGSKIDIALWILAAALTGSYTFWAWTILDINRLIMTKLFYQGEAPVEYAWSTRSKQVRKFWEQAQRAS